MAKYIVIAERNGDIFTSEFNDREVAIKQAVYQYYHLTARERKAQSLYVLESVNPDEEAEDHLDGNIIWNMEEMSNEG